METISRRVMRLGDDLLPFWCQDTDAEIEC